MCMKLPLSAAICLLAMTASSLPANAFVNWQGPGWYVAGYEEIATPTNIERAAKQKLKLESGPYSTENECDSAFTSSILTIAGDLPAADCHYLATAPAP